MKLDYIKNIKHIITHADCPDGMASAIILHHALGIEPVFMAHNTFRYLNLKATSGMLFCDIIPPKHRVHEFIKVGAIVLDHHNKAKDIVEMFGTKGVFADEKSEPGVSGAVLAFREIWEPIMNYSSITEYAPQVANFATLAGVRDTWQKSSPFWKESCYQAAALTFFSWEHWRDQMVLTQNLNLFESGQFPTFLSEMSMGEVIYNKRLRDSQILSETSFIFNEGRFKVAIFNDPDKLLSDTADILRSQGVNIIIGFSYTRDRVDNCPTIVFGLRSDSTFDVGDMATKFGGGGHSRTAGFSKRLEMGDLNPFTYFRELFKEYVH